MYSVCIYLKVVTYYNLSGLSTSVMGFQFFFIGVGEWGELYPVLFLIFGIF